MQELPSIIPPVLSPAALFAAFAPPVQTGFTWINTEERAAAPAEPPFTIEQREALNAWKNDACEIEEIADRLVTNYIYALIQWRKGDDAYLFRQRRDMEIAWRWHWAKAMLDAAPRAALFPSHSYIVETGELDKPALEMGPAYAYSLAGLGRLVQACEVASNPGQGAVPAHMRDLLRQCVRFLKSDPARTVLLDRALEAAAVERARQIHELGYSAAHDDEHDKGELARAAAWYALPVNFLDECGPDAAAAYAGLWPLDWSVPESVPDPTPAQRKRELEKAIGLLAAEWDRLDRVERRL